MSTFASDSLTLYLLSPNNYKKYLFSHSKGKGLKLHDESASDIFFCFFIVFSHPQEGHLRESRNLRGFI